MRIMAIPAKITSSMGLKVNPGDLRGDIGPLGMAFTAEFLGLGLFDLEGTGVDQMSGGNFMARRTGQGSMMGNHFLTGDFPMAGTAIPR